MTLKWLQDIDLLQSFLSQFDGSHYVISRWIFLRALGVIYLIAFVSLWVQIKGLIGSQGILPISEYLSSAKEQLGLERYRLLPTIFWFGSSDFALQFACAIGVFCALLLTIGIAPVPCLVLLWVLYLSLTVAGRTFLSFQWDILLLEVGFLSIFFAPFSLLPGLQRETAVSSLSLFLLWFLLFRLMFESGVVKFTAGDEAWRNFTALDYHYFTQPLPVWTSWYMHHAPQWFQKLSLLFTFASELVLPFFLFLWRPLRITASAGIALLNLLIGLTGNYNFFNLLTIALCFLLIDDTMWSAILPQKVLSWLTVPSALAPLPTPLFACTVPVAVLILFIGGIQLLKTIRPRAQVPVFADRVMESIDPFRSINPYGLFRVMTRERPEIVIEGTHDGELWLPYEFKWKPGDVKRYPRFVEPHQPRLDWQMWFAALGTYQQNPWFTNLLGRLLIESPDVLYLLKTNPFSDAPPKQIRAMLYDYRFTTLREKRETGAWWKRELKGLYHPPVRLR